MSETQTITVGLDLPRTKSSSSDDSFTALMTAVLDSARSSASLESTSDSTASTNTSDTSASSSTRTSNASNKSTSTSNSVPSLAESGRTVSTSSRSSSASLSASAAAGANASANPSPSASTTPSAASSTTPSPCPSILRSSSSSLTLPSRTGSPSITFAPLPTTEPRKRSSAHPLGVAARSRLLRHRRMLREQGFHPDDAAAYPYPYRYGPGSGIVGGLGVVDDPAEAGRWGEEIREAEAGVDADEDTRARAGGGRGHRSRAMSDPAEGDALVSLGRLVKGAGKSLWRSISMKEVRSKEGRPSDFAAGAGSEEGAAGARAEGDGQQPPVPMRKEKSATLPRKTEVHLFDDPDARAPSDEGGVWEEVVEEESWKKLLSKPPSSTADPGEQQCQGMPRSSVEPRVEVKRSKRVSTMDVFAARIR